MNKSYDNPLISIIIPIYNVGSFLEKCLDSVINQSYENIEIICVNDGSTDNSSEVINNFSLKDKRIITINQKNSGLSGARNSGICESTGEYIIFLDGDDWLDYNACEVLVKYSKQYDSDVILFPYIKEYSDKSEKVNLFNEKFKIFESKDSRNLYRRIFGLTNEELRSIEKMDSLSTAWGKFIKSEFILNNNLEFIDTKIIGTEDLFFNINLFYYINKAVYIEDIRYHYRKNNESSLTKTYNPHIQERWKNLHKYIYDYIQENNLEESYITALNNRIAWSIFSIGINIFKNQELIFGQKKNTIKEILNDTYIGKSIQEFDIKYLSFKWKLFFWLAKKKHITSFCILLMIIIKILERKK